MTLYRWCTIVSGTCKYDEPEVENVARGRSPNVTFSTSIHHISMSHERPCFMCFVVFPTANLKLLWRNASEYRPSSKNAHSPNYCSWLAVCVNCSANFYFKIALINRFKVYLIKIPTVMSKRKQKQHRLRLQCRIYLVNVMWLVVIIMTTGRPWRGDHSIMSTSRDSISTNQQSSS